MGCGGSKESGGRRTKKRGRKGKGSAKTTLNEDVFLDSQFYCPTTELEDNNTLAHGTKDDDIAFLEREVNPDIANFFHF